MSTAPRLHVVEPTPEEPKPTWAEVRIDEETTLRVQACPRSQNGFRWYELRPGKAGTIEAVEVMAPRTSLLISLLTGLEPPLRREGLER